MAGGWTAPPDLPLIQITRGSAADYGPPDDWDDDDEPERRLRRTHRQRMRFYNEVQMVGLIVIELLAMFLLVGVIVAIF